MTDHPKRKNNADRMIFLSGPEYHHHDKPFGTGVLGKERDNINHHLSCGQLNFPNLFCK